MLPSSDRDEENLFFPQRALSLWNSLPEKAVEAESLNIFKAKVDRKQGSERSSEMGKNVEFR